MLHDALIQLVPVDTQYTDTLVDRLSAVMLYQLAEQTSVQGRYAEELNLHVETDDIALFIQRMRRYLNDEEADRLGDLDEWEETIHELQFMGKTAYRILIIQAIKTTFRELDELRSDLLEPYYNSKVILGLTYDYVSSTYPYLGFTVTIQRPLSALR